MAGATYPRRTFVVVLRDDGAQSTDVEPFSRYEQLSQETEDARRELAEELERKGLADQADLEPATGFHMLLVEATDEAIEFLRESPRVAEVAAVPDSFPVDLM